MAEQNKITAAVVGGGVIGGGWVARFLLMGADVCVYDPDPQAERKINEVLSNAKRALPGLYEHALPASGELRFCASIEEAVTATDWVSECVPERLDIKQSVLADIQQHCPQDCIVASSTSGFKPSELQQGSNNPRQIIVAHPFNPVYLVPLVELVGHAPQLDRAARLLSATGMKPLKIAKEIDAHIADRLLEAVWREGLWLINDGIATTEEIDDAIRYGFGLRWAQMGLFETYRIAGGEAGMAHFIKQFGPALKWPWTKLMEVPELTDELVDKIASQSDAQSGQHDIRQLERIRDDNLLAIMRSLKRANWGAGELINSVDEQLRPTPLKTVNGYLQSIHRIIPSSWTDYNGHMNDTHYGEVFSHAGDSIMRELGVDADYIANKGSYFTVDLHIGFHQECHAGDEVNVLSRIELGEGKKLKLQHALFALTGNLLASCDQFLLHVDLNTRRSSDPTQVVQSRMQAIAEQHKQLNPPYTLEG